MSNDDKTTLIPRLRFPEFRKAAGWESCKIGAKTVSFSGGTPDTSTKEYYSGDIPFIRSAEIGKESTDLKLTELGLASSAAKLVKRGDVLVALYGANSGEVSVAKIDGAINQAILCLRSEDDNLFLFQFICARKDWITATYLQGGQGNLSGEIIKSVILSFPTLSEQRKIADCLTSLDELIVAQKQKLKALWAHKKSLMQRLFVREDETLPQLRFPEFKNAPEWMTTTLGDIAAISSGTTPARANLEYFEGGHIAWVKTTDLNNSVITHTEECITAKAGARINPTGSVLVAMYGGFKQIGRTGMLGVPAATNQAMSVLVIDYAQALPIYVLTWLNAKVDNWKRIASSSRKDPNVTGSDVAGFPIYIPAKPEQQRIADCLSSLDILIDAETRKLESFKTHKQGMMQQLFPSLERL